MGNIVRNESRFHQGIMDFPWRLPLNLQSQLHSLSSLDDKCKIISSPAPSPEIMGMCRQITNNKTKPTNKPLPVLLKIFIEVPDE